MSLGLAGLSWITPLGSDIEEVWARLLAGDQAPTEMLADDETRAKYLVRRVPLATLKSLPAHARLRRVSAISRFAAAAGLAALSNSSVPLDRIALVFAISNGGVIYTRRFYSEIVKTGAQGASPLLFPETVFNAPASHLAAILGISGASYTVVGDGAVGILALRLAEDLMAASYLEGCLVVGAEEIDPLVCEAYRRWRLLRDPRQPSSARGMIVSEGAGAVLLTREECEVQLERVDAGANFFRRNELSAKLRAVVERLEAPDVICIGSGNGTFVDRAEAAALGRAPYYSPKHALGDSIGASVLWQLIVAAQALRTGRLPRQQEPVTGRRALVLSSGVNQQLGGSLVRVN